MADPRRADSKRVLVIRIGRLGDTILATPVIPVLQDRFGGDVSIDFVCSPGASAYILGMDDRVNRIFPVAHRSIPWRLHPDKRVLEKHSREHPYDLAINLECGSECDDFYGFVHCLNFCGRPNIEPAHRVDRHCVDTEKSIYADVLGAELTAAAETSLHLRRDLSSQPAPIDGEYVVINPGFSGLGRKAYRSHRAWPGAHWLKLVELLMRDGGVSVLVNGTSEEESYFPELLEAPGVHSLFGSSLEELVTALTHARCLVSVDTGTMHLAAALRTPVVALFGPSNPLLTGPYSRQGIHRALVSGVDCQPCVGTPAQKKCGFNRCMAGLAPEMVFESIQQVG